LHIHNISLHDALPITAYEAKNFGFIRNEDVIVVNKDRQIAEAKKHALIMAEAGYTQPIAKKVKVLGKEAMGMFYVGSDQMVAGKDRKSTRLNSSHVKI